MPGILAQYIRTVRSFCFHHWSIGPWPLPQQQRQDQTTNEKKHDKDIPLKINMEPKIWRLGSDDFPVKIG